jgi:RNA-directed DNA polymerase
MTDRAMQALHLLALEPIAETTADPNSYGFRPMRASRDAIGHCYTALSNSHRAPWVLDADISGCFDNISHDWMLANIPMDKAILRKWLTSGFIWKGQMFATEAGTPQGGIATPRTQKVTFTAYPQFVGWRRRRGAVGWRWLGGDRVPDRDGVIVDQDFLYQEADDFLPLSDFQRFRRLA